ncbi:Peptidase family M48 [Halopseudomonas litoralis]|uniref:Peptidase family M48 n=1 Tax=Halopseudomonas litoralis TaxID=797277 RepID=A0A1H1TEH0_9GAMM|nr:M48 family metalloprotease [Halopseudomonas litoralis]SDS58692.1 Peptidase family M48 [Halopseudomonas litoralis]
MKLKLSAVCVATTLLVGCVGGATQSVRNLIPGQLAADQPILAQVDKTYSPGLLAVGHDEDRYRNQSLGLGLVSHPEAERYINKQLDRLKQASGITGLPGQAYLFADTALGARASPDGNIYIPYVVLRDIDSTDELAALLAHELAHTIRNHNSSDLFVQVQKKAVMAAGLLANYKSGDSGVMRGSDEKLIENVFTTLMVSDGFINPGWTRRQELEADKLGMDILIVAGYNGDAMFTLLDKMAAWEERNKTEQSQRNALIDQMLMVNDPGLAELPFGDKIGSLLDRSAIGIGSVVNRLNQNHDSAEKRYDDLLAYVDVHYPDAPAPTQEVRSWRAIAKSQKAERIWQGLTRVVEARNAVAEGDLSSAEKRIRTAVNPHTNNQNFLRQSFYELRAAQQQKASMQQNLALGMNGAYPSFLMHVEQAQLTGDKDPATAKKLMSTFDQYGRPPTYYQYVITMAESASLNVDALALVAECTAKYIGDGISCGSQSGTKNTDISYGSLMKSLAPR